LRYTEAIKARAPECNAVTYIFNVITKDTASDCKINIFVLGNV
jgi:hypothetical protein